MKVRFEKYQEITLTIPQKLFVQVALLIARNYSIYIKTEMTVLSISPFGMIFHFRSPLSSFTFHYQF
jgi:succinyl-CoA synthetase beta subunit